jgi:glycopeptide antibiotics resistance protein
MRVILALTEYFMWYEIFETTVCLSAGFVLSFELIQFFIKICKDEV